MKKLFFNLALIGVFVWLFVRGSDLAQIAKAEESVNGGKVVTASQIIFTNGSTQTTAASSTLPGGVANSIQRNNGTGFYGDANFAWDGTSLLLKDNTEENTFVKLVPRAGYFTYLNFYNQDGTTRNISQRFGDGGWLFYSDAGTAGAYLGFDAYAQLVNIGVANTTQINFHSGNLTNVGLINGGVLSTGAFGTIGNSANQLVRLDSNAKLPAVDGSQLTNVTGTTPTKIQNSSNATVVIQAYETISTIAPALINLNALNSYNGSVEDHQGNQTIALCDNNASSRIYFASSAINAVFDLVNPVPLNYFNYQASGFNPADVPGNIVVWGSTDNSTYTQVGAYPSTGNWSTAGAMSSNLVSTDQTTAYRYVKFQLKNGGSHLDVAELPVHNLSGSLSTGTANVTVGGVAVATFTGNNTVQTTTFAGSPNFTTPNLGIANATTYNKVTITAPSSNATLTIANGKTFTASNSITLTGTDSATYALANVTGTGNYVLATSPTLTTPDLGAANATTYNRVTVTAPSSNATLTIANGKTAAFNNSMTFNGTDGATYNLANTDGTGNYTLENNGTFNVSMTPDSGSITLDPSHNACSYIKVGRLVTVQGRIRVSAINAPSGDVYISPLPYASSSSAQDSGFSFGTLYLRSAATPISSTTTMLGPSSTALYLRESGTTGEGADVANHIAADSIIGFTETYLTD